MTALVKLPGVYRSYVTRDGAFQVMHHRNANVWSVQGGPPACYPLPPECVYFRTLREARAEVMRRAGMVGR